MLSKPLREVLFAECFRQSNSEGSAWLKLNTRFNLEVWAKFLSSFFIPSFHIVPVWGWGGNKRKVWSHLCRAWAKRFHCLFPAVTEMHGPSGSRGQSPTEQVCSRVSAPCRPLSCSEVVGRGTYIFSCFLSVKSAAKWVQIGLSTDGVSSFFVKCLCCLLYHWQNNLISN